MFQLTLVILTSTISKIVATLPTTKFNSMDCLSTSKRPKQRMTSNGHLFLTQQLKQTNQVIVLSMKATNETCSSSGPNPFRLRNEPNQETHLPTRASCTATSGHQDLQASLTFSRTLPHSGGSICTKSFIRH